MKGKCKNCGADEGLHHYQTMQCPVGGREANIGQKQEWMTRTFEEVNDATETIEALLREKVSQANRITELEVCAEIDTGTIASLETKLADANTREYVIAGALKTFQEMMQAVRDNMPALAYHAMIALTDNQWVEAWDKVKESRALLAKAAK